VRITASLSYSFNFLTIRVAEVAKARGLQPHTVRAIISRLGSKSRVAIDRTQVEGRGLVYRRHQ